MLFRAADWDGLRSGAITVAFRWWKRPTVKEGGRLRTPVGVLAIDSIAEIAERDIRLDDARRAGYSSVDDVVRDLEPRKRQGTTLFRVTFHHVGEDDRIALRADADLDDAARAEIDARLARLDKASSWGPWTRRVLDLIAEHPARRAGDLAEMVGRERLAFKADVRKLKALGLTESLEVGYRLSPRGRAYLGPHRS